MSLYLGSKEPRNRRKIYQYLIDDHNKLLVGNIIVWTIGTYLPVLFSYIKRGCKNRAWFGEIQIQILLTIKNSVEKMIVVIDAENFKKRSKDLKDKIALDDRFTPS